MHNSLLGNWAIATAKALQQGDIMTNRHHPDMILTGKVQNHLPD